MKGQGNLSFRSVKRPKGGNRCILRLWKSPLFSQGMVFRVFWISTWCISYLSFIFILCIVVIHSWSSPHGNCTTNLRVRRLVRRGLHGHYVCLKVNRVRVWTPQCGRIRVVPHFLVRDSRVSKTRACVKITPREKSRVSPFFAWGDFRARSRFARSTIPEEKWGTTCILPQYFGTPPAKLLLSAIATLPQLPPPPQPPPPPPDKFLRPNSNWNVGFNEF